MTEQEMLETKARIYDLSVEINELGVRQQMLMAEIEELKQKLQPANAAPIDD